MGSYKRLASLLSASLICTSLSADTTEQSQKNHIAYLARSGEVPSSLKLYLEFQKKIGKHDFEVLEQIGTILLEQEAQKQDEQSQLLSIMGAKIGGLSSCLSVFETAIFSKNPQVQISAIQLLGQIQDDRSDEILLKAMSSEFFGSRLEAGYYLSLRKHRNICGQMEALMYRVPDAYRAIFPEFFALMGTPDATSMLRQLIQDPESSVRVEAILSAARNGRDDLLSAIRTHATHLNPAEQEACVAALGYFRDSSSIALLKKLSQSTAPNVRLAANTALYQMGDISRKEKILLEAEIGDLFAVNAAADIEGSENILFSLCQSPNIQVRFNATLALLRRKDPRCMKTLLEFIVQDGRDLTFYPQASPGRSLISWKVLASAEQHQKHTPYDLRAIALAVREQILKESIELPEKEFLYISKYLIENQQQPLVPLLVALLQNLQTEPVIAFLENQTYKSSSPLTRNYCHLALFRIGKTELHAKYLKDWIQKTKEHEMIRFRPTPARTQHISETAYELTAEENSRLLIEIYLAFADRHDEFALDQILDGLIHGNIKNRAVLSGLLLHSLH